MAAGLTVSVCVLSVDVLKSWPPVIDRLDRVLLPGQSGGQRVGRAGGAVLEIGTLMAGPIAVVPFRTVKVTVASLTVPAVLVTVASSVTDCEEALIRGRGIDGIGRRGRRGDRQGAPVAVGLEVGRAVVDGLDGVSAGRVPAGTV